MTVRTGNDSTGRFPYGELDLVHAGDSFLVRVTALPPYRDPVTDELNCHIDFLNISKGTNGRFENILLAAKQGNEGRRGPMIRFFQRSLAQGRAFIPSPVVWT
jgi:hypothetical protein